MDTQIDRRFKRAWEFFAANAAQLVLGTLVVCLGHALIVFGPWTALNLLREISDCLRTGRPVRWQATYETTSTFLPAWGLAFTMGLGIVFGLALCVIPGVLLAIAWFHAPTMVAEGRPVLQSLGDSYRKLARHDDWVATLLNGLILVACLAVTSFTAVLTLLTLPLALAFLAQCTIEVTHKEPPVTSVGEPIEAV